MAKGKYAASGKKNIKFVAALLAVVLLMGSVAGGTVAWLIAKSNSVVNTFTYGDINIKLDETDPETGNPDDDGENEYKMLPGIDIDKDPKVTVLKDSEDCWLFVKLDKSADPSFDTFLSYEIADGWTRLKDAQNKEVPGVYFRKVNMSTTDTEIGVLKDDTVTVKGDVTKEMLNALTDYPTLTVTAYAVQFAGFEPKDAAGNPQDISIDEAATNAAVLSAWQKVTEQEAANP